jgi:hypothetical protein
MEGLHAALEEGGVEGGVADRNHDESQGCVISYTAFWIERVGCLPAIGQHVAYAVQKNWICRLGVFGDVGEMVIVKVEMTIGYLPIELALVKILKDLII